MINLNEVDMSLLTLTDASNGGSDGLFLPERCIFTNRILELTGLGWRAKTLVVVDIIEGSRRKEKRTRRTSR